MNESRNFIGKYRFFIKLIFHRKMIVVYEWMVEIPANFRFAIISLIFYFYWFDQNIDKLLLMHKSDNDDRGFITKTKILTQTNKQKNNNKNKNFQLTNMIIRFTSNNLCPMFCLFVSLINIIIINCLHLRW